MQGLAILSEANNEACKFSSTYRSLLSLRNLGNRHRWHLAQGTGRFLILIRRNRHIYQLDESHASGEYHTRSSGQVPVEHHLQVRHTQEGCDR
jgi:hypothetical protein